MIHPAHSMPTGLFEIPTQTRRSFPRAILCGWTCAVLSTIHAQASDVLVVDFAGGGDHTTIQDAANAASEGGVVLVQAGTYAEEVTGPGGGIKFTSSRAVVFLNAGL